MHFPERSKDQTEERILPLINIVFLLLIFFIVAGSLTATEPFDISPPNSKNSGELDTQLVTILMSENGDLAVENKVIKKADLLNELSEKVESSPDLKVNLKVDQALPANQFILFTQELNDIGLKKVVLVTEELTQ